MRCSRCKHTFKRKRRQPSFESLGVMALWGVSKMLEDIKEKGRQEGIKECKKKLEEIE